MLRYKNLTDKQLLVGKIVFKSAAYYDQEADEKLLASNLFTPDNIKALLKAEEQGQIRFISGDRSVLGPEAPAQKRRILIKRNGGIGDILMTTPLLTVLRQKDPNALIYYETIFPELLESNSDLSVLIKGSKNRLYGKFDEIIDLNRVVETLKCGGGILSEEVSTSNNRIDLFFDYAKFPRVKAPQIKYFIKDIESDYAERLLRGKGVTKDTILIGYAGFAIAHRRAYPVKLAKQLFDLLCENPKVKIVIFGRGIKTFVYEDRSILADLPSDKFINLCDKTTIRQLGALISKCKAMICCDTGLLHLTNAIGVPNVALFGTIKSWLRVKHYPLCQPIEVKMPCSPCNDRCDKCPKDSRIELNHTLGAECMWKITPEEIRDAVFDKLKLPVQKLHKLMEITQADITQKCVIPKSIKEKVILLRRRGGLGDVIMSSALCRAMKEMYPACNIVFYTDRRYECIFYKNPYVSNVYSDETELESLEIERDILLDGLLEHKRFDTVQEDEKYFNTNRTDLLFERLKLNNISDEYKKPKICVEKQSDKWAKTLLRKRFGNKKKTICIQADCATRVRIYPLHHFFKLNELLNLAGDYNIVIVGKNMSKYKAYFDKAIGVHTLNLVGKTTVSRLMGVVNNCDLTISVDSGVVHIAGALGKKFLALYGNIDPQMRLKYYDNYQVIYLKGGLPCIPCGDTKNPCAEWKKEKTGVDLKWFLGGECMRLITPERVMGKIKEIL